MNLKLIKNIFNILVLLCSAIFNYIIAIIAFEDSLYVVLFYVTAGAILSFACVLEILDAFNSFKN